MKNIRLAGINDSGTPVIRKVKGKTVWVCPYYKRWDKMLKRCYSEHSLKENPSYRGCTVSEEWLCFSNFRSWRQDQEWEGVDGKSLHIDKDLLIKGNRVYCKEACTFLHPKVNNFTTECKKNKPFEEIGAKRREYLNGRVRYQARCCNPFREGTREADTLGCFDTILEAHLAWKGRKLYYAEKLVAEGYTLNLSQTEALLSRYK
jgi:hypothetical protein